MIRDDNIWKIKGNIYKKNILPLFLSVYNNNSQTYKNTMDFFIDEINNLFVFYRYDSRKTSSIRKSILDRARWCVQAQCMGWRRMERRARRGNTLLLLTLETNMIVGIQNEPAQMEP